MLVEERCPWKVDSNCSLKQKGQPLPQRGLLLRVAEGEDESLGGKHNSKLWRLESVKLALRPGCTVRRSRMDYIRSDLVPMTGGRRLLPGLPRPGHDTRSKA